MNIDICGIFSDLEEDIVSLNLINNHFINQNYHSIKIENALIGLSHSKFSMPWLYVKQEDTHIILVGRIDNLSEIKRNLSINSGVKTETVLMKAYKVWNRLIFRYLVGAFILVIIDNKYKKCLIGNDHYSFIPLFFYNSTSKFVFGTNIKQILDNANLPKTISLNTLAFFLTPMSVIDESGLSEELTFFENISKLPSATILELDYGKKISYTHNKYWCPPTMTKNAWGKKQDCYEAFKILFFTILEDQILNHEKIGFELSGGIDSSCIVCVANELLKNNIKKKNTFTYTLEGGTQTWYLENEKIDEILLRYPNLIARKLAIDNLNGYLEISFLKKYKSINQPNALNLPLAMATIIDLANNDGCSQLYSGEGADWYLEGTDIIWDYLLKKWKILDFFSGVYQLSLRKSPKKVVKYFFKKALIPILPRIISSKYYLKHFYESTLYYQLPDIFESDFKKMLMEIMKYQLNELNNKKPFQYWSQRLENELLFPPNCKWQSINSQELDIVFPYLDRRLIEFGLSVPPDYKFKIFNDTKSFYGASKQIQRNALKSILPSKIINAQIKSTYSLPVHRRVEEHLMPIFTDKNIILKNLNIINIDKVFGMFNNTYLNKNLSIDVKYYVEAWLDTLINLELWLRKIFEDDS